MAPSDEELLHRFYGGNNGAFEDLATRLDPLLARIAQQILWHRTGSAAQAAGEWDINDRVGQVWVLVAMTQLAKMGQWPHQRLSALTWLVLLLSQEMDRHLGLRPPF